MKGNVIPTHRGQVINSPIDSAEGTLLEVGAAYSGVVLSVQPGSVRISPDQLFVAVPTIDPGVEGQVWNDEGVLKVSAGEVEE